MDVLCLDLEGVLVPEIWQAVARATGVDELKLTTRDIPVYDDLMQRRLGILDERDIGIRAIRDAVAGLEPLPGAADFMAWARQRYQIAVLSDTFYDLAMPLVAQLGHPLLLCHRLIVEDDRIVGYRLRQEDPKRHAVRAFKALNYRVVAAGDSFNDVSMLDEAHAGIFFNAPQAVIDQYPALAAVTGYAELKAALESVEGCA